MHKDQNLICLASIAGRDESVFSKICSECSDQLFKYITHILPDEDIAMDVVHETFMAFLEHKVKMEKVISIKAYLFKSYALGLCMHFARHFINQFGEQYRNTLFITAIFKFFSIKINKS